MHRFHQFLMYEEVSASQVPDPVLSGTAISIEKASAKWLKTQPECCLKDINFTVRSGHLAAIVGKVGSGKSSLIQLILRELDLTQGQLRTSGRISYAAQEPWLFMGSLRQNILFGAEYDADKYQKVVRACDLERDFALFPFGDKTLVGERGVTLSGGQKARVNLARAIYKDADIYLLDDPLSAVDAKVGRHIFDQCINGYLHGKTVVLVTHQLQFLHKVSHIYLMENGGIEAKGAYGQGLEGHSKGADIEQVALKKAKAGEEAPKTEEEKRTRGHISWEVYRRYIFAGGHWSKIMALVLGFMLSQLATSFSDYFQSIWYDLCFLCLVKILSCFLTNFFEEFTSQ